jgi:hypothetical protein
MASRIAGVPAVTSTFKRLALVAVLIAQFDSILATDAADCTAVSDEAARRQVEQKIVLLERMTTDSEPARRVLRTDHREAQALLVQAIDTAARARTAFGSDCFTLASDLATAGLGSAAHAFRLSGDRNAEAKREFEELRQRTASYLQTVASQPPDARGIGDADLAAMRRQLARAEELALEGSFESAMPLLAAVADRLQRRLIDLFDQRTLVYAREFAGPAEEFAYLVEHYRGYRMLLDGFDRDRQTSSRSRGIVVDLLEQAEVLSEQAESMAAAGTWPASIEAMANAIEYCERAARAAGVSD